MSTADNVRGEVKALMQTLIDLGDYTRDELIEIVDDSLAAENKPTVSPRTFTREDLQDLSTAIVPLASLAPDMDPGDLWGSVMGLWFDIADILYYRGDAIPDSWEYRRGMSIDAEDLNFLLVEHETDYLVLLGNRCHYAADTLRALGFDY